MLRIWKNFCKEFRQLCVGGSVNADTIHINSGVKANHLSSNQDVNNSCTKAYQQATGVTSSVDHEQSCGNQQESTKSSTYYQIRYKWNLSKSVFLEICGLSSAVALGWEFSPLRKKQNHLSYGFSSNFVKVLTELAFPQLFSGIRLTINDVASGKFSNVIQNSDTTQASGPYLNTTTSLALSITEEINETFEEMVKNLETSSVLGLAEWQNFVGVELTKSAKKKVLSEYDYLINRFESDRFSEYQREAFNCFAESKKLGSIKGCYNLGLCYEQGIGTSIDKDKAVMYYEEAACKNHPAAQYNLGLLLYRRYLSDETSKENDIIRAYALLRQAAQQGLQEATSALIAISGVGEQDAMSCSTTSRTTFVSNSLCNGMASLRKAVSEPRNFTCCHRRLQDTDDTTEFEFRRGSISFYLGD